MAAHQAMEVDTETAGLSLSNFPECIVISDSESDEDAIPKSVMALPSPIIMHILEPTTHVNKKSKHPSPKATSNAMVAEVSCVRSLCNSAMNVTEKKTAKLKQTFLHDYKMFTNPPLASECLPKEDPAFGHKIVSSNSELQSSKVLPKHSEIRNLKSLPDGRTPFEVITIDDCDELPDRNEDQIKLNVTKTVSPKSQQTACGKTVHLSPNFSNGVCTNALTKPQLTMGSDLEPLFDSITLDDESESGHQEFIFGCIRSDPGQHVRAQKKGCKGYNFDGMLSTPNSLQDKMSEGYNKCEDRDYTSSSSICAATCEMLNTFALREPETITLYYDCEFPGSNGHLNISKTCSVNRISNSQNHPFPEIGLGNFDKNKEDWIKSCIKLRESDLYIQEAFEEFEKLLGRKSECITIDDDKFGQDKPVHSVPTSICPTLNKSVGHQHETINIADDDFDPELNTACSSDATKSYSLNGNSNSWNSEGAVDGFVSYRSEFDDDSIVEFIVNNIKGDAFSAHANTRRENSLHDNDHNETISSVQFPTCETLDKLVAFECDSKLRSINCEVPASQTQHSVNNLSSVERNDLSQQVQLPFENNKENLEELSPLQAPIITNVIGNSMVDFDDDYMELPDLEVTNDDYSVPVKTRAIISYETSKNSQNISHLSHQNSNGSPLCQSDCTVMSRDFINVPKKIVNHFVERPVVNFDDDNDFMELPDLEVSEPTREEDRPSVSASDAGTKACTSKISLNLNVPCVLYRQWNELNSRPPPNAYYFHDFLKIVKMCLEDGNDDKDILRMGLHQLQEYVTISNHPPVELIPTLFAFLRSNQKVQLTYQTLLHLHRFHGINKNIDWWKEIQICMDSLNLKDVHKVKGGNCTGTILILHYILLVFAAEVEQMYLVPDVFTLKRTLAYKHLGDAVGTSRPCALANWLALASGITYKMPNCPSMVDIFSDLLTLAVTVSRSPLAVATDVGRELYLRYKGMNHDVCRDFLQNLNCSLVRYKTVQRILIDDLGFVTSDRFGVYPVTFRTLLDPSQHPDPKRDLEEVTTLMRFALLDYNVCFKGQLHRPLHKQVRKDLPASELEVVTNIDRVLKVLENHLKMIYQTKWNSSCQSAFWQLKLLNC